MKDRIRKILKEETEKQTTTYYLVVDKRTNKVMDPGLWRIGFENSGGSSYGTWGINFSDPRSVAQYSFEDMDEIEEVLYDIDDRLEDLKERFPLDDKGKRASNIQGAIDYYTELLQHLEVRGFKLAVDPIKVEDPFKKLFGFTPYDDEE